MPKMKYLILDERYLTGELSQSMCASLEEAQAMAKGMSKDMAERGYGKGKYFILESLEYAQVLPSGEAATYFSSGTLYDIGEAVAETRYESPVSRMVSSQRAANRVMNEGMGNALTGVQATHWNSINVGTWATDSIHPVTSSPDVVSDSANQPNIVTETHEAGRVMRVNNITSNYGQRAAPITEVPF